MSNWEPALVAMEQPRDTSLSGFIRIIRIFVFWIGWPTVTENPDSERGCAFWARDANLRGEE